MALPDTMKIHTQSRCTSSKTRQALVDRCVENFGLVQTGL